MRNEMTINFQFNMVRLVSIAFLILCLMCLKFAVYGKSDIKESGSEDESDSSTSSKSRYSSSSVVSSSSASKSDYSSVSLERSNKKIATTFNPEKIDFRKNNSETTEFSMSNYAAVTSTLSEVQKVTDKCINCICEATGGCKKDRVTQVEINTDKNEVESDSALGPLRITRPYWEDAGSPKVMGKHSSSFADCANDMSCAAKTMKAYMARYPFDCNGDGVVNCSDYAAIHNRGPFACHNSLPVSYEERFLNCWNRPLEEDTNKDESESWFTRFLKRSRTTTMTALINSQSLPTVNIDPTINQEDVTIKTKLTSDLYDSITETTHADLESVTDNYDYEKSTKAIFEEPVSTTRQEIKEMTDTTTETHEGNFEDTTINGVNSDVFTTEPPTEISENIITEVPEKALIESSTQPNQDIEKYSTEPISEEPKVINESGKTSEGSTFSENTEQDLIDATAVTEITLETDGTTASNVVDNFATVKTISVENSIHTKNYDNTTSDPDYEQFSAGTQFEDTVATTTEYSENYQTKYNIESTTYKTDKISSTVNHFDVQKENNYPTENENNEVMFSTSQYFTTLRNYINSKRTETITPTTIRINVPPRVKEITDDCIHCICEAASDCDLSKFSDNSLHGPFRITKPYWEDAGKPEARESNANSTFIDCVNDMECAERTVRTYMKKYHFDCNGDGVVNCTDYAAIHNNGPYDCKKPLPDDYLSRFLRCTSEMKDLSAENQVTEEQITEKGIINSWFSNILGKIGS